MLDQRRRRWLNIELTWGHRLLRGGGVGAKKVLSTMRYSHPLRAIL